MKRLLHAVVVLLVALLASRESPAGNVVGLGRSVTSYTRATSERDITICFLPDTQNGVSSELAGDATDATGCLGLAGSCTGDGCTKSIYCDATWYSTGAVMMRNLAYDLTGQWDKIDYTRIADGDKVLSRQDHAIDHARCDIILSLGDMADIADGYQGKTTAELATLGPGGSYTYQLNLVRTFWGIIKASRIPYLPLQGNHDPNEPFTALMTSLDIASESWFYQKEPTYGLSNAILVPTATGRPLCIVGVGYYDCHGDDTRDAATIAWVTLVTGCGGNYPTIITSHDQVINTGPNPNSEADATSNIVEVITGKGAVAGTTGTSEIFMIAGGHLTAAPYDATTYKNSYTGLFGADTNQTVYFAESNFQETNRHNENIGGTGLTPSDGAGTFYTIVTLHPDRAKLCAHDWSPYWQGTTGASMTAPGESVVLTTSSSCFNFDFDGRYR